jgi:hypothetical protein
MGKPQTQLAATQPIAVNRAGFGAFLLPIC